MGYHNLADVLKSKAQYNLNYCKKLIKIKKYKGYTVFRISIKYCNISMKMFSICSITKKWSVTFVGSLNRNYCTIVMCLDR